MLPMQVKLSNITNLNGNIIIVHILNPRQRIGPITPVYFSHTLSYYR